LGRRFAAALAAAGAQVIVTGRDATAVETAARELGDRCAPAVLDMSKAETFSDAIDAAEHHFGTVTILVNNAGVVDAQRAHRMPMELIDSVINTNLRGPFVLACEIAGRLIKAKVPGRIVNISSSAAFHYEGNAAALYATTKGAVNRMTEALAVEWARFHINVNAIAPGGFNTDMMAGNFERVGSMTDQWPRKRLGEPAQLDSTLLYLCAPASELVTGTIVRVDDGQMPR
jgi:NAD(P)-dependent dehydrogenase (short-subunit alcohol dehydrogenase family)